MTALRVVLSLIAARPLSYHALTAQAKADSSSDTTPRVGGKWILTSAIGAGPYVVIFVQTGNKLRADVTADVLCAGTGVKMFITLEGEVHGRAVWLRPIRGEILSGRIDSDLADRCGEYRLLRETADFRGQLSADGKRIEGPYDYTGDPTHIWRFKR
jgi:hypothetical protein